MVGPVVVVGCVGFVPGPALEAQMAVKYSDASQCVQGGATADPWLGEVNALVIGELV